MKLEYWAFFICGVVLGMNLVMILQSLFDFFSKRRDQ